MPAARQNPYAVETTEQSVAASDDGHLVRAYEQALAAGDADLAALLLSIISSN